MSPKTKAKITRLVNRAAKAGGEIEMSGAQENPREIEAAAKAELLKIRSEIDALVHAAFKEGVETGKRYVTAQF